MNMILGLIVGGLIGWICFAWLGLNSKRGIRASLLIGLVGGGIGMQLASMLGRAPGNGELDVFALAIAAAIASALLVAASTMERRS